MTVTPLSVGHIHGTRGRVVVTVSGIAWYGRLENGLEVGQQQWLMFVDDDSCRRVKRLDDENAEADARVGDKSLEFVRQVDEIGRVPGRDTNAGVTAGRSG